MLTLRIHLAALSLSALGLLGLLGNCARASEVLAMESFDKLELAKLPGGYLSSGAGSLSLVDEPGRGKVLKIANKPDGWPFLGVSLDAAKVRGRKVRVSAWGKFPGNYTPVGGKDWARPRMYLAVSVKNQKDPFHFDAKQPLQPGRPDWQQLMTGVATVDAQAEKVEAFVRIDMVAAEVFFDDFVVELDPDEAQAPPKPNDAAPAGAAVPAAAAPAVNEAVAAKAPLKSIDDGGVVFSPQVAVGMQKGLKPGAAPRTLAFAGPGLPLRELEAALPEKWKRAPAGKEFSGSIATPRNLLAALPELLAKEKPEVIFLAAEAVPARKPSSTERQDWEDVARLCLRMGAVPVLGVPPGQEGKDDMRAAMLAAAGDAQCPVIDLRGTTQAGKRAAAAIDLLEKFVFCRVAPETVAGTKKPTEPE